MLGKHQKKILSGAILGFTAALIVWVLANYIITDLLYTYEAKTYDWRVKTKIADVETTIDSIIIIDIDARSTHKLGKWSQWPRSYHTRMVDFLVESGASSIGLDVLYDRDTWRPQQDVEFIQKIKSTNNVYTALYFALADSDNFRYVMHDEPAQFESERFYNTLPRKYTRRLRHEERFESEFFELLNASKGVGHVNFNADVDGVVRSIHLFTVFNDHIYPSLSFKMFMDIDGIDSLAMNEAGNLELYSKNDFQTEIPLDRNGNMLINYSGGFKTFRYISFYDVLHAKERNLPPEFFENKVIFVGTSLAGLFDLRNVPFMQAFPGVEIHANILYTLLQQNFIYRLGALQRFIIILLFGVILGALLSYSGPLLSITLIFVASAGHVIVSTLLYFNDNLWVEIVTPLLTVFITFALVYMYRYVTEEKNKRFIRTTFSHFVTKSVVDELLANPDKIKLGGEKKLCTVLFSDIAGFTTISEQLSPEELVRLLNEYLTEMTNIIFKYDGMLDKYEGDAIMAVFGAPISHGNHAYSSCASALEMQYQLAKMRDFWKKQGKPELKARIGLNTGQMVVGNMGSDTRFDYTVMGDAVNLGARLESANKIYATNIMIGEGTYKMAGDLIIARPLDLLRVKGKSEPAKVYELVGTVDHTPDDETLHVLEAFGKGFESYLQQNWDWAISSFKQALSINKNDGPSLRYLKRCETFKGTPPGDDWDGVFTMTTK